MLVLLFQIHISFSTVGSLGRLVVFCFQKLPKYWLYWGFPGGGGGGGPWFGGGGWKGFP